MEYKVTYTLQKEVSVTVEINDPVLIEKIESLGNLYSDKDFINDDPRRDIEQIAYEIYSGSLDGEIDYDDDEVIVNRSIKCQ